MLVGEDEAAEVGDELLDADPQVDEVIVRAEVVQLDLAERLLQADVTIDAGGAVLHIDADDLVLAGAEVVNLGGGGDADAPVDGTEGGGVAVEEVEGGAYGFGGEKLAALAEEVGGVDGCGGLAGGGGEAASVEGGDGGAGELEEGLAEDGLVGLEDVAVEGVVPVAEDVGGFVAGGRTGGSRGRGSPSGRAGAGSWRRRARGGTSLGDDDCTLGVGAAAELLVVLLVEGLHLLGDRLDEVGDDLLHADLDGEDLARLQLHPGPLDGVAVRPREDEPVGSGCDVQEAEDAVAGGYGDGDRLAVRAGELGLDAGKRATGGVEDDALQGRVGDCGLARDAGFRGLVAVDLLDAGLSRRWVLCRGKLRAERPGEEHCCHEAGRLECSNAQE